MSIGENIKRLRELNGMSQSDFGKIAGVTDKAVSTWEAGIKEPRMGAIQKIADHFGIKKSNLIEENGLEKDFATSVIPLNNHRIPVLGYISAGLPLYAEQQIIGYTLTDLNGGAEYFGLVVKGDSMTAARIHDRDILIVRRQSCVDNGDIAVVMVDGENATVKRFRQDGNMVTLMPQSYNPEHQPQLYSLKDTDIRVLGKVVRIQVDVQ